MKQTKIIDISFNVFPIACDADDCTHEFALISLWSKDDGSVSWLHQSNVEYCPYCGKKQNNPSRNL